MNGCCDALIGEECDGGCGGKVDGGGVGVPWRGLAAGAVDVCCYVGRPSWLGNGGNGCAA